MCCFVFPLLPDSTDVIWGFDGSELLRVGLLSDRSGARLDRAIRDIFWTLRGSRFAGMTKDCKRAASHDAARHVISTSFL